jgi:aminopeptidase-like protein
MDMKTAAGADTGAGQRLYEFAARLYPICRSITGNGVRKTLELIRSRIPLTVHEVPSGTRVFDWEIPLEWNVEDAAVLDADGRRVVDFHAHNLHLVSYSEPLQRTLSLEELSARLHVLPEHPDWIPYRTSYYRRDWGFCMRARERAALRPGRYRVEVRSSLARGALTYGELLIPGRTREQVLLFTHVCHPSLANDNTSGMAVATALGEWLASEARRFTYRLVFAPGTIGSLTWLKRNERQLPRVRHALVLALLGDPGVLTYKRSRRETHEIDAIAAYVLGDAGTVLPFSPYGYDERQLCSPGFDLPAGRLTRSVNGGYPQYHTSADDLTLITPRALQGSLEACQQIIEVIESNTRFRNRKPKGEPRLGGRGLYGTLGGREPAAHEHATLWLLNQSDGAHSLLDIAARSGLPYGLLREAADRLAAVQLLTPVGRPVRAASKARPQPVRGATAPADRPGAHRRRRRLARGRNS